MQRLKRMLRWKYVVAVALILAATLFVSRQYQKISQQCEQKCAQLNGAVLASTVHAESCDECEKIAERHLPGWYRAFAWPDGVTAWAIILTLMTIAEQTRETRRSAVAMEKTVRLMRASNSQWVELEPYDLFTKTEEGQPVPPTIVTIHPRWKIINNTPLPLTVKKVAVAISKGEGWETYIFEYDELLAPKREEVFFAPFALNTSETKEFLTEGIELSIAIDVLFVGVSGVGTSQHFGDFYFCKLGHMEINHPIGKGPQHQYWEKDDSPNMMVSEKTVIVESKLDGFPHPS